MRDNLVYLQDILEAIKDIESFTEDFDYAKFQNDKKTIQAVIRELEIIGEAVKQLSSEIKEKEMNIPWKEIAGMRDKLIHQYFGIKLNLVWKTIQVDIPILKNNILSILKILT